MTVAVIGHKKIDKTQDLIDRLNEVMTDLIVSENADTFIFGSKSAFDDLCYKTITELKYKYQHIQRIWARAEYECVSREYVMYLLTFYEGTFFPEKVKGMGMLSYIKRNEVIVDMCDVLVVYYDKDYKPSNQRNSGTKLSVAYANRKNKRIINVFR